MKDAEFFDEFDDFEMDLSSFRNEKPYWRLLRKALKLLLHGSLFVVCFICYFFWCILKYFFYGLLIMLAINVASL